MKIGFRIFPNRLWELKYCIKYNLEIEYRIDNDNIYEYGRKKLEKILNKYKISIASLHYPFRGENILLSHYYKSNRRKAIESIKKYLGLCESIKTKVMVIHDEVPLGGVELYEKSLREISEIAREKNIKIALENARTNPYFLLELLEYTGNLDNIGIAYDLGHANIQFGNKEVIPFIERAKEKIFHLHLHDNNGVYDEHKIPGQGIIDYPKVIEKLNSMLFKGYGILELSWSIETDYAIRKSLENLKKFGLCNS
ncbi:MAG: sugar phosphate isomerase/epimerase family protein [Methanosarcinales archaeon]